ncbi:MAG: hypothetical protein M1338_04105 [Patescibacteria group bacterium]|nr:hypothetical protein [Patescibacteria group bacterium]
MEIKTVHIIPLVLVAIILAGGIYYWQKNNNQANIASAPTTKTTSSDSSGIVLGDSNEAVTTKTAAINDGQTYMAKIAEIRKPINDAFTDLTDKMKYPNLFPNDQIMQLLIDINKKINSGIEQISKLDIAAKYQETSKSEIESLNLLNESLVSLKKSYQIGNANAQADREAFAYKIDQSNNILKNIQIPN